MSTIIELDVRVGITIFSITQQSCKLLNLTLMGFDNGFDGVDLLSGLNSDTNSGIRHGQLSQGWPLLLNSKVTLVGQVVHSSICREKHREAANNIHSIRVEL